MCSSDLLASCLGTFATFLPDGALSAELSAGMEFAFKPSSLSSAGIAIMKTMQWYDSNDVM